MLMRLARFVFPLLCLAGLLVAASARAQSVRWEQADNGMANAIMLVFENCEPDGQPALPAIPGVSFTGAGRSESINMVNFQTTRTVALTYLVRGPSNPPIQIPAFSVRTNKGTMRVERFTVAAPAAPLEAVASSKLVPAKTSVWVGEVFGLNYELSASRRTNPQISPTFDWNAAPLVAEDWSKYEVSEPVVNGERRVHVLFRSRVIAKTPNTVKLEAASHLLSIQTGTIGFGIISSPRMEQVSVTSDQPVIEVRPLPGGAPAGFSGAVGQFTLKSKVVPEKAAVGEPITWTLELGGTGNWPDIDGLPSREVSNDFQVVQPKAKRTPAEGKLFDVTLTEDVVLVPTKPGTYTLGPVSFSYFDPKSGTYKTVKADRTSVTIAAPAAPQFNVTPAPSTSSQEPPPPAEAKPVKPANPAPSPNAIPRDPLPGTAAVRAPLAPRQVWLWSLAPIPILLGLWVVLALQRAQATDPLRPRREARARLLGTIERLRSAPVADRPALLLAWQRDTAALWQLTSAAPSAGQLRDAPWSTLWTESERALYGAKTDLPADWSARAEAALATKTVPGFRPFRLFLPQNLMPFAAALVLAGLATATWLHAADLDGLAAYRKADFAGAEKAFRQRLAAAPTDWIARHNLSLALAQQDRPGEAAAHAAAAFVQNPSDPATRWNFGILADKAGSAPGPLAGFTQPSFAQRLARVANPADWQFVLIGAAWLLAGSLGLMLVNAYGRRTAAFGWIAAGLSLATLATSASATSGLLTYGLTARPEAVVVGRPTTLYSIPTEADTTQKTAPLVSGSLGLATKDFLNWTQLSFDNGQTGWVRKADLVPLWR